MLEDKIRSEVEGRRNNVDIELDWFTPSGNRRSAPMYVVHLNNSYLGRERELKAKTRYELEHKVNDCIGKWNEQEIKKRVAAAKKDAKEQGQAETTRLDEEAKGVLAEMAGILEATLSIDDKIDWEAERDTRTLPPFTYASPPSPPSAEDLVLPKAPGWMWLFRGRRKKWEAKCDDERQAHAEREAERKEHWEKAVDEYNESRDAAYDKYQDNRQKFLIEQEEFNDALADFRRRFEAHDAAAVEEYASRVLERSSYPESLSISHNLEFEEQSGTLVVHLELPSIDEIPSVSGYKFVAKDNRSSAIALKKKELAALHSSILDQIVIRTMHEIFEGCYTSSVQRVVVIGFVTALNRAIGQDERRQVRCIASDRDAFEAMDLSRVEPAACVEKLSEGVGQMRGVAG